MRYWVLAGLLILGYLLQSVVAIYLAIGGVIPDLLLALVVTYGLLFGPEIGLGAGILAGLLTDLTASRFIGLHILALGAVGLGAGVVEEKVFKDNLLLAPTAGFIASAVKQSITLGALMLFGWRFAPMETLRQTILPAALYDMVVTWIVYGQIYKYYLYLRPDPRGTIVLRRR